MLVVSAYTGVFAVVFVIAAYVFTAYIAPTLVSMGGNIPVFCDMRVICVVSACATMSVIVYIVLLYEVSVTECALGFVIVFAVWQPEIRGVLVHKVSAFRTDIFFKSMCAVH